MKMVYDVRLVKNFRELLDTSVEEYGDRTAFLFRKNGEEKEKTYAEARRDVRALAAYIRGLVSENAKVALIGPNGYGWAISYLAICCGVGVVVPIDREMKREGICQILKMTGAEAIICTGAVKVDLTGCGELGVKVINLSNIDEILCNGRVLTERFDPYNEHEIISDGLSVLIYTSGTSGASKGVMLSQYNICYDIMNVLKQVSVTCEDRVLSVLPLSHTYECTAGFLAILYSGGSIAYNENLRRMVQDMQYYRPTIFVTVPIIMETVYRQINSKIEADKAKKAMFSAARMLSGALQRVKLDVRKKIYKEVHEVFGGRLRLILCGGAALRPELKRRFTSLGFKVYCGYGLTETSPIIMGDNDFYHSIETSGKPLCGVKLKLLGTDGDGVGELAVRSPVVMLGYYDDAEETDRAFEDGWFKTGDLAKRNDDGSYTIVGRSKSMIVKNNGKKVLPEELELLLCQSPYISDAFVYGVENDDGTVEVAASLLPDKNEVGKHFEKEGITSDGDGEDEDEDEYDRLVYLLLRNEVKAVNARLAVYKHIRTFYVRKKEFSLTPSKKIKRADSSNRGDGSGE